MDRPQLTFPPEEAAAVTEYYSAARIILEYGSGGSTVLASELEGKTISTIESDAAWLKNLKAYIDGSAPRATVHYHHANIGPTQAWGRPKDLSKSAQWSAYPTAVWHSPGFQQPDLVLIDGRFRVACFIACAVFTRAPVTILFDDYRDRPRYHYVERFALPVERHGRLAVFRLTPGLVTAEQLLTAVGYFQDWH